MSFQSLEEFIRAADGIGEVQRVNGASLDDVGCLTELLYERDGPMLLFDKFDGYPEGYRICSNAMRGSQRMALAMGLPVNTNALEIAGLDRGGVGDFAGGSASQVLCAPAGGPKAVGPGGGAVAGVLEGRGPGVGFQ